MDTVPSLRRLARPSLGFALVCSASALACGRSDSPSDVTGPPDTPPVETDPVPAGRLAFVFHPPNAEMRIYSVRTDGANPRPLTPPGQMASTPAWSPDGTRLAYRADFFTENFLPAIWVVRSDGSDPTRVAPLGEFPFWIGDDRIGYTCSAGLCAVGADPWSPDTLFARANVPNSWDDSYRLSPDGRSVTFVRHTLISPTEGSSAIYVANLDGTGERRLTSAPSGPSLKESSPTWSPDGQRILYLKDGYVAAVVNAKGGVPTDFSHLFQQGIQLPLSGAPAWSPTGSYVVFGRDARQFYIARADGSGTLRRVTAAALGPDAQPSPSAWSWTP